MFLVIVIIVQPIMFIFFCLLFLLTNSQTISVPHQVRIALTGIKPSHYSIMWQSNDTRVSSPSIIKWGYSKSNLEYKQYGTKKLYSACNDYHSVVHEVLIQTEKKKNIFYTLSNNENGPWSKIFHFKSEKSGPFKFIAYGDSDTRTTNGKKIISDLNKIKYENDLIIHAGDFAYDTPSMQYRWDDWGNSLQNITSSM